MIENQPNDANKPTNAGLNEVKDSFESPHEEIANATEWISFYSK